MTQNQKKKILIVEDAIGIARGYETSLSKSGYDATICRNGTEAQSLIDRGKKFDLAILDIVLPVEDPRYTLTECQDTGVRLINQMIGKEICRRFYVITVRSSLQNRIERLCEEKKAVLLFEHKLDHEPETFLENVERLLKQSANPFLPELREHIDTIEGYVKKIKLLSETDKQQLVSSMTSIRKILTKSVESDFEEDLRRVLSVLRTEYYPNTDGVLKKETERTIAAIADWLKNHAKRTQ